MIMIITGIDIKVKRLTTTSSMNLLQKSRRISGIIVGAASQTTMLETSLGVQGGVVRPPRVPSRTPHRDRAIGAMAWNNGIVCTIFASSNFAEAEVHEKPDCVDTVGM